MNTTNEVNNTQTAVNTQENVWVDIRQIIVPDDARVHTPEDIDSRAASMAREGQLENILLSKEGDKLVLVYGRGRLESAKKLEWHRIRADIKEGLSESKKLMIIIAENEEREEASPFYTAGLYKKIMAAEHLSAEQLPEYLQKSRALVYKYLSLGTLASEVQAMSTRVDIGLYHWVEILKLQKPEDQIKLAQECAEKGYSVRELQVRVKQLLNPKAVASEAVATPPKKVGAFQFTWKGRDGLLIKGRVFKPLQENISVYACELCDAFNQFTAEEEGTKTKAA